MRAAAAGAVAKIGDGKKPRGDNEKMTETATEPIKAFLGTIREGWGDKFGASFAAKGLEQDEDLGALGTSAYQDELGSLLERLLKDGAKTMELKRIKNQFAPRASDEPRCESAGGGTGTVAVDNGVVAARAAAAND